MSNPDSPPLTFKNRRQKSRRLFVAEDMMSCWEPLQVRAVSRIICSGPPAPRFFYHCFSFPSSRLKIARPEADARKWSLKTEISDSPVLHVSSDSPDFNICFAYSPSSSFLDWPDYKILWYNHFVSGNENFFLFCKNSGWVGPKQARKLQNWKLRGILTGDTIASKRTNVSFRDGWVGLTKMKQFLFGLILRDNKVSQKHRKNCECCPVSQLINCQITKIVMNSGSQLLEL